jgi:phosphatidate phosphatase APP1
VLDASSSGSLGTDVQKRSLGPILAWLKKHAPKQYQKVKAAARKGKAAVKEWYNKLPKAVRVTIQFLWSGSVWSLIEALWKYFTS